MVPAKSTCLARPQIITIVWLLLQMFADPGLESGSNYPSVFPSKTVDMEFIFLFMNPNDLITLGKLDYMASYKAYKVIYLT